MLAVYIGVLASWAPCGRRWLGRVMVRGTRHRGELMRGGGVGRALLPRPALHHEPWRVCHGRSASARIGVRTRIRTLSTEHVAEVAQRWSCWSLVAVCYILHLYVQLYVTYIPTIYDIGIQQKLHNLDR